MKLGVVAMVGEVCERKEVGIDDDSECLVEDGKFDIS